MILCVDNNFESWKKSCAMKLKEEVFGVAMPASVFMEIYGQDICTTPEDKSHMRREANGRGMQFRSTEMTVSISDRSLASTGHRRNHFCHTDISNNSPNKSRQARSRFDSSVLIR